MRITHVHTYIYIYAKRCCGKFSCMRFFFDTTNLFRNDHWLQEYFVGSPRGHHQSAKAKATQYQGAGFRARTLNLLQNKQISACRNTHMNV